MAAVSGPWPLPLWLFCHDLNNSSTRPFQYNVLEPADQGLSLLKTANQNKPLHLYVVGIRCFVPAMGKLTNPACHSHLEPPNTQIHVSVPWEEQAVKHSRLSMSETKPETRNALLPKMTGTLSLCCRGATARPQPCGFVTGHVCHGETDGAGERH